MSVRLSRDDQLKLPDEADDEADELAVDELTVPIDDPAPPQRLASPV